MDKKEFQSKFEDLVLSTRLKANTNEQFLAIFLGGYVLNAIQTKSQMSFPDLKAWINSSLANNASNMSESQLKLLQNVVESIDIPSDTNNSIQSDVDS